MKVNFSDTAWRIVFKHFHQNKLVTMSSSRPLILSSNACTSIYPNNTRATFTNKLPSNFSLRKTDWEVCLQSVSFENSFGNIPPELLAIRNHIVAINTNNLQHRRIVKFSFETDDVFRTKAQLAQLIVDSFVRQGVLVSSKYVAGSGTAIFTFHDFDFWMEMRTARWLGLRYGEGLDVATSDGHQYVYWYHGNEAILVLPDPKVKFYPSEIRIHLKELEPFIDRNGYSTNIATVPYAGKMLANSGEYLFHHATKETEFYDLDTDTTPLFNVELRDQNDNPLNLTTGQPTVVVLTLRQKMGKSFMATVDSRQSSHLYPDNTNSSFRVVLPGQMQLSGEWELAVSSCQLPQKISLIAKMDSSYSMRVIFLNEVPFTITFSNTELAQVYNKHDFVTHVTSKLLVEAGASFGRYGTLHLTYSEKQDLFYLGSSWTRTAVSISNPLARLLGANISPRDTKPFNLLIIGGSPVAIGQPQLHLLIPQAIFMYTDISTPIIVGDSYAPILKVIPYKFKPETIENRVYLYTPEVLGFVKVSKSHFAEIFIRLMDISGSAIEFDSKTVTSINLVFRQM